MFSILINLDVETMKKVLPFVIFLMLFSCKTKESIPTSNQSLFYNKKTQLLEISNVIEFSNLPKETIYNRTVNWFSPKYQQFNEEKYNVVLSYKGLDSIQKMWVYKITGRFMNSFGLKNNEKKGYVVICGQLNIFIVDNKLAITASSFKLPDFQNAPLEGEVLENNKTFKKHYKRIEDALNTKTDSLFINLSNWIENYLEITRPIPLFELENQNDQ